MKILHITAWYPTRKSPKTAIWIQRHIEALELTGNKNRIYHLEISQNVFEFSFGKKEVLGNLKYCVSFFLPWFVLEILAILLVAWIFTKERRNRYDIINFHIAYPNLTYWHWIKKWVKTPIVITEHWSAYHFNFGTMKSLPRIQKIFKQNIPVITVSKALGEDIKRFSKSDFPLFVVPNAVSRVFSVDPKKQRGSFFLMLSYWKSPKNPFPLLSAFQRFNNQTGNAYQIQIGGYGPLYDDMLQWKTMKDESNSIIFLGIMSEKQIAEKMQTCMAFLHPTNYETFSVVCAEAVSCETFVIAPNVGGIPEVVADSGILLDSWNEDDWFEALNYFIESKPIGHNQSHSFSFHHVGQLYTQILDKIIHNNFHN